MTILRSYALAGLFVAMAALALTAAPVAASGPGQAPCYNGIVPFNPYVDNCALPNRPPRVLGSAPDQTALLNCSIGSDAWRKVCLSQFVNGGPFPGIAIGVR
ncbi:MAG: hypothetical protein FGM50_05100 [Mycobacterium sp.]|nr:hypothetical protein [Mycobacterium sp.]